MSIPMSARVFQALRSSLDLTVPELAELLGVERRSVQRYETGARPVPSDIAKRLTVLNAKAHRESVKIQDAVKVVKLAGSKEQVAFVPELTGRKLSLEQAVVRRAGLVRAISALTAAGHTVTVDRELVQGLL